MDRNLTITVDPDAAPALTMQAGPLRGSVVVLIQFDVCEEIRLDELRKIFPARKAEASLKKAPAYVRYQRPPVEETLEPLVLESGERLAGEIKYYDYGVVSLEFELPFAGSWDTLVELSCRWTSDTNFEKLALRIVKQKLERAAPALIKPYASKEDATEFLQEDYFIFHVREIDARDSDGGPSVSANDLLAEHGDHISQIVRGEMATLSEGERQEILGSRMSYYPTDLAVIGWNAAFLYDTQAGAETAIQLLQYANSQLLEFRHYDDLLTTELESVYDFLDAGGTGLLSRWRTARAASKLHTVLLDVNELTERADNAIKFLSDMFSARLYKLCAAKVGVPDYKDLVKEKLQTAEDLYRFMVEQFNQSRAFILELMVVVILIIELIYFFKGRPI
ncbi:MAG TPA: hypothetical protein VE377_05780 [Candidatus Dormibacteraeota bacterium]|nr:hypothetical protein [Candidatus Dormibacteraeota bacterium]